MTVVLGIVFLMMQADRLLAARLGGPDASRPGTFGTTYYTLTGFHGAHVFGGVIMLSVVLYRGMAGQFSARHHDAVEAASLYWHFVDVVWILLFSLLYLLPGKTRPLGVDRHASAPPPAQRGPRRDPVRGHRRSSTGRSRTSAAGTSTTPGTTMLIFLGAAMALMAYVLVAGSSNE